jgi:hypothetical protein
LILPSEAEDPTILKPTFAVAAGKFAPPDPKLVPDNYAETVEAGRLALLEIERIAKFASNPKSDPEKVKAETAKLTQLLQLARKASVLVHDVTTKGGMNDFASIERWQNVVYDLQKNGKDPVPVEGVMIGFNMAGLNGLDPSMKSGTAVKEMCGYLAPVVAKKMGLNGAQFLGTWGNNLAVSGIDAKNAERFRDALLQEVTEFLSKDQEFPLDPETPLNKDSARDGIKRRIEATRTSELPIRNWSEQKGNFGFTISYAKSEIPAALIEKAKKGDTTAKLEVARAVVKHLQELGDREAFASIEKKAFVDHEIPADHPAKGKGVRPLRVADPKPLGATGPLTAIGVLEPAKNFPTEITLEDVRSMPRPAHAGGEAFGRVSDLEKAVASALKGGKWADVKTAGETAGILQKSAEAALFHDRFKGFYKPEAFPMASQAFLGKGGGYIQFLDIKNFSQVNKDFPGGIKDDFLAKALEVLVRADRDKGLDSIYCIKGGDEIVKVVRAKTLDGRVVTPEILAGAVQYYAAENARIFSKHLSDQKGKVPGEMGGLYRNEAYGVEATYSVKGDKVYVEKGKIPEKLKPEFLKTAQIAAEKGLGRTVTGFVEVKSLDEVGLTTRMDQREGTWTDPITGKETAIRFLIPPTSTPTDPGAKKVQGTFEITQSAYVYVSPAPLRADGDLTSAEELAGGVMKKQKTLFGADKLPEGAAMPLAEGGPLKPSTLETLRAAGVGRLLGEARNFGIAITGARLVWGGVDHLTGGEAKAASKVVSLEEYKKLGIDFGVMAGAGWAGERTTAWIVAKALKEGKGAFVKQAGGIGAATVAVDLIHKGKVDWGTAVGAGMMLGVARVVKWGLGKTKWAVRAAAAGDPEPVSKAALAVEMLVFEGISLGFEKAREGKIDGMERDLRFRHAAALKKLDGAMSALADGIGDEKAFAAAAKDVRGTFSSYASFLMVYRTPAGAAYQEALSSKDKAAAKDRLEKDFSRRMSHYEGEPVFVSADFSKPQESYQVNLALTPEGLSAQYQTNIVKRVKILLERMKKAPDESEKYLAMFRA